MRLHVPTAECCYFHQPPPVPFLWLSQKCKPPGLTPWEEGVKLGQGPSSPPSFCHRPPWPVGPGTKPYSLPLANTVRRGGTAAPATSALVSPMPLPFSAQRKAPRAGDRLMENVDNHERAHGGSRNLPNHLPKQVPPSLLTGKDTEAAFCDSPVSGSNGIAGQAGWLRRLLSGDHHAPLGTAVLSPTYV